MFGGGSSGAFATSLTRRENSAMDSLSYVSCSADELPTRPVEFTNVGLENVYTPTHRKFPNEYNPGCSMYGKGTVYHARNLHGTSVENLRVTPQFSTDLTLHEPQNLHFAGKVREIPTTCCSNTKFDRCTFSKNSSCHKCSLLSSMDVETDFDINQSSSENLCSRCKAIRRPRQVSFPEEIISCHYSPCSTSCGKENGATEGDQYSDTLETLYTFQTFPCGDQSLTRISAQSPNAAGKCPNLYPTPFISHDPLKYFPRVQSTEQPAYAAGLAYDSPDYCGGGNNTENFGGYDYAFYPPEASEAISVNSNKRSDHQNQSTDNCAICISPVVNPISPDVCKHQFCTRCLEKWAEVDKTCPTCRQSFQDLVPVGDTQGTPQYHVVDFARDDVPNARVAKTDTNTFNVADCCCSPERLAVIVGVVVIVLIVFIRMLTYEKVDFKND